MERRCDVWPLLVGIIGAAALLCGKYWIDAPLLRYASLGLVAGSLFWKNLAQFLARTKVAKSAAPSGAMPR